MKILESYLGIAKELFGEGNLGENPYAQGKEPKPGDWWKSSEGQDYAMGKDGERQGPFNDAEEAEEYAKGQVDGDDGEDSAGKLSGAGDFERDGGEPEDKPRKDVKGREFDPKTGKGKGKDYRGEPGEEEWWKSMKGGEPEDKPFGGDTGADADSGYVSKNKPQKAKDLANDPNADVGPDSRGTEWDASYYGADDSAEWQDDYEEADDDGDDEKLAQIKWFGEKQGWGNDGELGDQKESITIDGKKYRPIKESKQHKFKEIYDRTFRSLK